jgi:hypothetical protein
LQCCILTACPELQQQKIIANKTKRIASHARFEARLVDALPDFYSILLVRVIEFNPATSR